MTPQTVLTTIKDLPTTERPREKLLQQGPNILTDAELIAILLGNGTKKENVLLLAQRMIKNYSLQGLAQRKHKMLREIKGIGDAKACTLLATFELAKRISVHKAKKQKQRRFTDDTPRISHPLHRSMSS